MTTFRKATLDTGAGALEFTSRAAAGALDSILLDLAGWYGGVSVTDGGPQRGLGHGAFSQRRRRASRAITLTGIIIAENDEDRDHVDRALSGLMWDGAPATLWVDHGDTSLWTTVELDGEIDHKYTGTSAVNVQIPLVAPDPFVYSAAHSTTLVLPDMGDGLQWGGGLFSAGYLRWSTGQAPSNPRLENRGNAAAWPRFTVRGNFPEGFSIVTAGRVVEYPGAVTPNAPVQVDYATGDVLVGNAGVNATHQLIKRQWTPIPPSSAVAPRLEPRSPFSEGWADATWSDTYL